MDHECNHECDHECDHDCTTGGPVTIVVAIVVANLEIRAPRKSPVMGYMAPPKVYVVYLVVLVLARPVRVRFSEFMGKPLDGLHRASSFRERYSSATPSASSGQVT